MKSEKITELITAKAKAVGALKSISSYIEKKSPKTLEEAKHMLTLVSVIATETVAEAA